MKLIIDMDEVICMFLDELCVRYNEEYGKCITPSQLKQYDLTDFVGEKGKSLFMRVGFLIHLSLSHLP